MNRIAKFDKISFEQFLKDYCNKRGLDINETNIIEVKKIWDSIKLPKRSTKDSAGYDIHSTINVVLQPKESVEIPTGIKVIISEGWTLKIYPRSGHGYKYRVQLDNSVAIIDGDYRNSDNEGHIFIKITNDTYENKIVTINEGDRVCQGIFVEYGITIDDDAAGIRNGGFGSTGV